MSLCHLTLVMLSLISLSTAPALNPRQHMDSENAARCIRKVTVDRQDLRVVFDLSTHLVNMQWTKVLPIRPPALRSGFQKVLVFENDDSSLGCKQC